MPPRNIIIIILTAVISYFCYEKARRDHYAGLFAEAIDHIESRYVEKVEHRELFEHALNGLLGKLDPYSSYIGPQEFSKFKEDLDQEFGGIGIIISPNMESGHLTVLSPVVGTPAHRAGVMAGDTILKVDDESLEGMALRAAIERLRGLPGTEVKITIERGGDKETHEIAITRAIIKMLSVLGDTVNPDGSWQYFLKDHPSIGYIRLTTFGEHTVDELRSALKSLPNQEMKGLILDLRSNAGGLLTAAIEVSDMFIGDGAIVSTRGRGGAVQSVEMATENIEIDEDLPMAVLINGFSASASEIVSACLQDHHRAVLVGERTWGKGTVQNIIPLEMGKSVIKLTTATFWRPSARNIHRSKDATEEDDWGVRPDDSYEVKLTGEEYGKVVAARNRADWGNSALQTAEGSQESNALEEPTSEDAVAVPEVVTSDETEAADENFEDPQLRRAIEYFQDQTESASSSAEAA
ncbi:MAG: peptidase S41 [Planctomycetaceae bacterium]|nr:peptidase S41 [Planctomycetaceae bacterium]MBP61019.1 peptidase S41 [Planctomycetaceae bacterium]